MQHTIERRDSSLRIHLNGKLTFSDHAAFQEIVRTAEESGAKQVEVVMEQLSYIDSSGIGMLLVLNDRCQEQSIALSLARPQGQVAKILRVANIDKMIPIAA
jgi:stage II sporulation protein AA (anti-sigma F factor antagonist)